MRNKGALKITAIYILVGSIWILFSDQMLQVIAGDLPTLIKMATFKGWFFMICTGSLLYWLISQFHQEVLASSTELLVSEERNRLVIEVSNDGVWDWDLVSNQVFYSTRWKEMLGYADNELADDFSSFLKTVHPADKAMVEQEMREHFENNKPYCVMVRFIHKTGAVLWIQSRGIVLRDETGTPYRMIGSHQDYTLRKQHEEEIGTLNRLYDVLSQVNRILVRTQSRQELFAQVCSIAVERGGFQFAWMGEHDRQIHRVVPVAWAGSPAEYVQQLAIFTDERPEGCGPTGTAVREGKTYICNDFFANPQTGPWRAKAAKAGFYSSAVFIIRCGGRIWGALNVYADKPNVFREKEVALLEEVAMTVSFGLDYLEEEMQRRQAEEALRQAKEVLERKVEERTQELMGMNEELTAMNEEMQEMNQHLNKSKEEADQANRAKSDFLAKMSHEIRTPINAIVGLNYLMLKTQMTDQQKDYMGKIILSANNLQVIINDVLDFSKIEANKLVLENVDFDLYEMLNTISNIISFKVYEKNLKLHFTVDAKVPQVLKGDPFRLQQILLNLANNAVKFTPQGEITVAVAVLGAEENKVVLQFTVRDTGIGIPRRQQDNLFDAFSQVDMSTTRKFGGTGLGLAICKTLVELMGGSIRVESEIGTGSCFMVTLAFAYCPNYKFVEAIAPNLKFLRVLLVCDNEEIRSVLKNQLEQFQFICGSADSGQEAVGLIREQASYDLIVIDQQLKDVGGIRATELIRQTTGDSVPIIMLVSAYRDSQLQSQAEAAAGSFNRIIYYPVGQSQLYNEIVTLFEQVVTGRRKWKAEQEAHNRFIALRNSRVLLVEDNEINQQVAKDILEDEGIIVDIAEDGSKAVELVAANMYDIVLMDIQMPVMDGYEATRKIREKLQANRLPIIALTADAVKGVADKVTAAGMNGYITKPIEPMQLLTTLKRWLKKEQTAGDKLCQANQAAALNLILPEQELPGLNVRDGLARINGKADRYLEILKLFKAKQAMSTEAIQAALAAGDTALAVRLAHTLKGAAGNCGFDEVAAGAASLEDKLTAQPDNGELVPDILALAAALSQAGQAIDTLLALNGRENRQLPLESSLFAGKLAKLVAMVKLNQVEAFDLCQELSPQLTQFYGQELQVKLYNALANFDWEAAEALLQPMGDEDFEWND